MGALAPDKGPPGTSGGRTQHGAIFGEGFLAGLMWGGAELAVDFVLIDVGQELIEEAIGPLELEDLIGSQ